MPPCGVGFLNPTFFLLPNKLSCLNFTKIVDLKKTKSNLLLHLEEVVKNIQLVEIPTEAKTYKMSAVELKDHLHIQNVASQLPKKGSHIYWFEVNNPSLLIKQFNDRQKEAVYKCARNNKDDGSEYVYVYVGSCTKTKLNDRFKQHCGWGNDQTYSLQLQKWLTDDT